MLYCCLFSIVLPIVVALLFGRLAALCLPGSQGPVHIYGLLVGLLIGGLLARIIATPIFQRMRGERSVASDAFYGNLGWVILVVAVVTTVVLFSMGHR